jgi:hypothetical protein
MNLTPGPSSSKYSSTLDYDYSAKERQALVLLVDLAGEGETCCDQNVFVGNQFFEN